MSRECTRCGRDIELSEIAFDGTLMWQDSVGYVTCEEFIESDGDGEFRPAHTIEVTA